LTPLNEWVIEDIRDITHKLEHDTFLSQETRITLEEELQRLLELRKKLRQAGLESAEDIQSAMRILRRGRKSTYN